jgi:hypothetical protein
LRLKAVDEFNSMLTQLEKDLMNKKTDKYELLRLVVGSEFTLIPKMTKKPEKIYEIAILTYWKF